MATFSKRAVVYVASPKDEAGILKLVLSIDFRSVTISIAINQ